MTDAPGASILLLDAVAKRIEELRCRRETEQREAWSTHAPRGHAGPLSLNFLWFARVGLELSRQPVLPVARGPFLCRAQDPDTGIPAEARAFCTGMVPRRELAGARRGCQPSTRG